MATTTTNKMIELEKIYQWITELCMPSTRENALVELSRQREAVQDLAPMLWHSFGSIAALLQEVISVYPAINPPTLTAHQSNRVCNSLALLQCVASHPETRSLFLQGWTFALELIPENEMSLCSNFLLSISQKPIYLFFYIHSSIRHPVKHGPSNIYV